MGAEMLIAEDGTALTETHEPMIDMNTGDPVKVEVNDEGFVLDDDGEIAIDLETVQPIRAKKWTGAEEDDGEAETPPTDDADTTETDTESEPDAPAADEPEETLESLRAKYDEERRRADGLQGEITAIRATRREEPAPPLAPPTPTRTPEEQAEYMSEYVTRRELDDMEARAAQKANDAVRPVILQKSYELAKSRHDDYDEVAKLGQELCAQHKKCEVFVQYSDDPYEDLYKIGMWHPAYQEKTRTAARQEGLRHLKKVPASTTAGVTASAPKGPDPMTIEKINDIIDNDPALWDKIKDSKEVRKIMGS